MRPHVRSALASLSGLLPGAIVLAQPDPLWIEQFGTPVEDRPFALAPDGHGGVYITGYTSGDLGGPNAGPSDVFLLRYDGQGAKVWAAQFGTAAPDSARALAPGPDGSVLVGGYTYGDLGGPNAGITDAILARYDSGGQQTWLRQFGAERPESVNALVPDGAGGVLVAGETDGSLGGQNAGYTDVFVGRYDSAGVRLWLTQFGGAMSEKPTALAPDGEGGAFITGWTGSDLGGPLNGWMTDIFLARFDGAGERAWLIQLGTDVEDITQAAAPDGDGGVYIAGSTQGKLGDEFAGITDIFLARFDGSGALLWIVQFGGPWYERADALAPDGHGGVYIAGHTYNDLGAPNACGSDVFIARYDADGGRTWIQQYGTDSLDEATALIPDAHGGAFLTGFTLEDLAGPPLGGSDIFLARYAGDCDPDLNGDGTLDLFDFLAFVNLFNAQDPAADCDGDGALTLFDFLCFVNQFNTGC